jgi:outer membrane protein insertion porin family
VGPSQKDTALGGNLYASALLNILVPLPKLHETIDESVRTHLFVNMGSLINYDTSATPRDNAHEMVKQTRVSVGAGLVCRTPVGRLELNLCHPVRHMSADRTDLWQLGLGFKFP